MLVSRAARRKRLNRSGLLQELRAPQRLFPISVRVARVHMLAVDSLSFSALNHLLLLSFRHLPYLPRHWWLLNRTFFSLAGMSGSAATMATKGGEVKQVLRFVLLRCTVCGVFVVGYWP